MPSSIADKLGDLCAYGLICRGDQILLHQLGYYVGDLDGQRRGEAFDGYGFGNRGGGGFGNGLPHFPVAFLW